MKRREFITLIGGAAGWPVVARAQEQKPLRRLGVLMNRSEGDQEAQSRLAGFLQGLKDFGWIAESNIQIDYRWGGTDETRYGRGAEELIALAPEVLVASTTRALRALELATRNIPIVFVSVVDPVGNGFVESMARPGENATGFTLFEFSLSGKLLEILKEIAPNTKRVGVLRDPTNPSGIGQFGVIQSVASSLALEPVPIDGRDDNETERALIAFGSKPNGALIVTSSARGQRQLTIRLAAEQRLPAVYSFKYYATEGGLISYGPDSIDQYRRAAGYVDRILKGEKPADLPVQAPTKYELVINLKTAKTLGLTVPPTLLARADEVIE